MAMIYWQDKRGAGKSKRITRDKADKVVKSFCRRKIDAIIRDDTGGHVGSVYQDDGGEWGWWYDLGGIETA